MCNRSDVQKQTTYKKHLDRNQIDQNQPFVSPTPLMTFFKSKGQELISWEEEKMTGLTRDDNSKKPKSEITDTNLVFTRNYI